MQFDTARYISSYFITQTDTMEAVHQ